MIAQRDGLALNEGDRVVGMDSMDQGGIKWGAEIAVDRPKWLTDQDIAWVKWREGGWSGFNKGTSVRHLRHSEWLAFRLPADHPHYQKQAKVDWSKPIEAVHVDGKVVAVGPRKNMVPDSNWRFCVDGEPHDCSVMFDEQGRPHRDSIFKSWTIRNVQTPEAPSVPAIDPALVERMRECLKGLAEWHSIRDGQRVEANIDRLGSQARDILKALEPVDPDEEAAEEIRMRYAKGDGGSFTQTIVAAIRRGRALERGG